MFAPWRLSVSLLASLLLLAASCTVSSAGDNERSLVAATTATVRPVVLTDSEPVWCDRAENARAIIEAFFVLSGDPMNGGGYESAPDSFLYEGPLPGGAISFKVLVRATSGTRLETRDAYTWRDFLTALEEHDGAPESFSREQFESTVTAFDSARQREIISTAPNVCRATFAAR